MDHRRKRRVPLEIGCWLVQKDEALCFDTLDFSESGISVQTTDPLPVGRLVNLQIFTPASADPVEVQAEVVWNSVEEQGSMGLQFHRPDAAAVQSIRKIAGLMHRHAPKPHGEGSGGYSLE